MGSQIQISSPFLKGLIHSENTVTSTRGLLLDRPTNAYEKRIVVIIQNTSTTTNVGIYGNATDSIGGILLLPLQTLSLDNYNGLLYAVSAGADVSVHIAIGAV